MTTTIQEVFNGSLRENVPLAAYTSARIGGPADYLIEVRSASQLADTIKRCWEHDLEFFVLGGGSNILVSDRGIRGLVILNRAKSVKFEYDPAVLVRAESGAVLSNLAHRTGSLGLSGLEWAAAVPGTVGGAVFGNAGAFGGDMAGSLVRAEILSRDQRRWWNLGELRYGYRTSALKQANTAAVILSAELHLTKASKEEIEASMSLIMSKRRASQPPGASMGSMFKNPPGDYAGRLIESCGLKGTRIGTAEISPVHANFFLNTGDTRAADIKQLIELVQKTVLDQTDVNLELEVELVGEW